MGFAYLDVRDYKQAATFFEEAHKYQDIVFLPTYWTELLAWRGLAYIKTGRFEDAIDVYVELGQESERENLVGTDFRCLQYNIGWNFAQLGMWQRAQGIFERAVSTDPVGVYAGQWLEWISKHQPIEGFGPMGSIDNDPPDFCYPVIAKMRRPLL